MNEDHEREMRIRDAGLSYALRIAGINSEQATGQAMVDNAALISDFLLFGKKFDDVESPLKNTEVAS